MEFDATVRIDTPGEADYFRNGGILQYVLRGMLRGSKPAWPAGRDNGGVLLLVGLVLAGLIVALGSLVQGMSASAWRWSRLRCWRWSTRRWCRSRCWSWARRTRC